MSDQSYQPPEIWRIELSRVEQVAGIKLEHLEKKLAAVVERLKHLEDEVTVLRAQINFRPIEEGMDNEHRSALQFAVGFAYGTAKDSADPFVKKQLQTAFHALYEIDPKDLEVDDDEDPAGTAVKVANVINKVMEGEKRNE